MPISKIILLTGAAEAPVLSDILCRHNPALAVMPVHTLDDLRAACKLGLQETRLIAFCSAVIVPADILTALPGPAYNFHPGPPERPGRYPAVFALYDGSPRFGVTVHEMAPSVDSGPIVTADWFDIPANADLPALESLALTHLLTAFARLAPYMATVARALPRALISWQGRKTSKADCDALCQLTPGMTPTEADRRKRACGVFLSG